MARTLIGYGPEPTTLRHARSALQALADAWPDVAMGHHLVGDDGSGQDLFKVLGAGQIGVAVVPIEQLVEPPPAGVTLAAVPGRLEARSALVTTGPTALTDLRAGATVVVANERDRRFLAATHPFLTVERLGTTLGDAVADIHRGDLEAVIASAASLELLEVHGFATLEAASFTPAPGQGALGLWVREDDALAYDLAFTLQHRPSFDRVRAERAFAAALTGRLSGALATVTSDGELTLFGALASERGTVVQGTITGGAEEAEELGQELGQDMLEQLPQL